MAQTIAHKWSHLFSVKRNGIDERTIYGAIAIHGGNHSLTLEDPLCFGRSLMKPFQMKPIVLWLNHLNLEQKAIALASHMGSPEQMATIESLLNEDIKEKLRLPATTPMCAPHDQSRKSQLSHPCAGKHLAILSLCPRNQWDPATYLEAQHPYNQLYRDDLEKRLNVQLTNYPMAPDGCGLPTWALPLSMTAKLFSQLAQEKEQDWIWQAFREHPELIGGPGRLDTEIMGFNDNVIAKEGADGLLGVAISLRTPIGIIIKLAHGYDPSMMAQLIYPILNTLGVINKEATKPHDQEISFSRSFEEFLGKLKVAY